MSADDTALFDRAAELAGGLSAAVASGLRLFVAAREKERGAEKMGEVEVEVSDGPVITVKRFTGRQLLRFESQDGSRSITYRVYATSGGQIAVYQREDPNWRLFVSPHEDAPAWNNPRTWSEDWWRSGQRSLSVFPDAAAMANEFPPELVQATMTALTGPDVEDLDI